jgi:Zn-finger nucleic acid-binding protein/membrane associated rhomboid family serine protease
MNCPIDSHQLEQKDFRGFEIDLCSECRGLWFDEGQFLATVKNISTLTLPEKYQLESPKDSTRPVAVLHDRGLRCPKDNSKLETLNYGGATNIFLDRCDTCKGIWLDGGEITRVKKDLEPKQLEDVMVKAFSEQWKEEKELQKQAQTVAALPYLLFSPAFLIPVPRQEDPTFLPRLTIILIFLAVFLNWKYPLGGPGHFFPWAAVILYFWAFGKRLERKLSGETYIFLCALASLVGGIATWFGKGIQIGQAPLVAMASMVSGVMGAFLILFPREDITFTLRGVAFAMPASVYLIGWLIFQFAGIPSETTMGVSFMSNIAGFIFGGVFALWWRKKNKTV